MLTINAARSGSALVLALLLPACALQSRGGPVPERTLLVRVAEFPGAEGFEAACAMRLRDPSTGREYQLVRSERRTAGSENAGGTQTVLESAIGDYGWVDSDRESPLVAELRVDCLTSRVVSRV